MVHPYGNQFLVDFRQKSTWFCRKSAILALLPCFGQIVRFTKIAFSVQFRVTTTLEKSRTSLVFAKFTKNYAISLWHVYTRIWSPKMDPNPCGTRVTGDDPRCYRQRFSSLFLCKMTTCLQIPSWWFVDPKIAAGVVVSVKSRTLCVIFVVIFLFTKWRLIDKTG